MEKVGARTEVKSITVKKWTQRIQQNHVLMMVLCCILPLAVLLTAVNYFGLSRSYLFWFVLLLCPVTHYFMMRGIHKPAEDTNAAEDRKGGGCH